MTMAKRNYIQLLTLLDLARIFRVSPKLSFFELLDKVNYVDNHKDYDKILACYLLIDD